MLQRKIKIILVVLAINIISCSPVKAGEEMQDIANHENDLFLSLTDELFVAISNRDKEKILYIAETITDEQIKSIDGRKFLRLKLQALTYCGEYEKAYNEVKKGLELFYDDYEFLIIEGALGKMLNIASNSYVKALGILEKKYKIEKSDDVALLCYYLDLVLNNNQYKIDLSKHIALREIFEYYSQLDKDELFLEPPLDYILLKPFFLGEAGPGSSDEWWLN